jgi:TPR repeat protein
LRLRVSRIPSADCVLKLWPMKVEQVELTAIFLVALGSVCCKSQGISIDIGSAQNSQNFIHYSVEAANRDPAADTPEEIAAVNLVLARKGNADAAWELGLAYLQGYGVPQDLTQAETWFEKGAIVPERAAIVGYLYAQGQYFPKVLKAADHWYTLAGRPGDLFELAELYKSASENQKATAIYLKLLGMTGHPEVRRAQLELGNFVLDGIYSAGDSPTGRAQNLEWARMIAQELLGQQEYDIAVDYSIGREDLSVDKSMWLHFCKRAAAYNIDLAQHYYAEGMMNGEVRDLSGYDYIVWTRLASQKQTGEGIMLRAITKGMSPDQLKAANAVFDSLVETRKRFGAYYPADDSLRNPDAAALAGMHDDDPDVQLRRAFALEKAAALDGRLYSQALSIYRTVRDHRQTDIRFALGRDSLTGVNGVPKSQAMAEYWLHEAANRGSKLAQELLARLSN